MTNHRSKSLRRNIPATLLWTLGLLLLTNMAWSAWFAASTKVYDAVRTEGGVDVPHSRSIGAQIWRAKRVYIVVEPFESSWEDASSAFDEIAPRWLQQHYARYREVAFFGETDTTVVYGQVGWPLPLLWTARTWKWNSEGDGGQFKTIATTGVDIGRFGALSEGDDIVFPIRPIWTGQVFYAAFCLCAVILVRQTLRRFRVWRNHCPNCNYDLRAATTGTCPECGAQVGSGAVV